MPVPKQPNKKQQVAEISQKIQDSQPVDAGRAAVIAELVKGGMSYPDAVQAVSGSQAPAKAPKKGQVQVKGLAIPDENEEIDEDEIIDAPAKPIEIVEVSNEPTPGAKMIEDLYGYRKKIEQSREAKKFKISVILEQRIFDWLVYACISEATMRGRPDLTIEDFLTIKLKELKASDPSSGGRRSPSTSGPKDLYNPATGRWGS